MVVHNEKTVAWNLDEGNQAETYGVIMKGNFELSQNW